MASFANLTANLNLNIQNFASNMRRASSIANQFSANLKGQINGGLVEPAKKSKFEFKDVARIVQGIMISKVFYGGLNAIRNATDAVWQFSQELEYAKIAYSNLFGDTALADEFINVLKDFAATTPFSFTESEAAAKRLLAYGIQYKNVMYVMQGVLAASSMQGNPQVIESVSRALGQIYTKGRLMNEEMRQLAEAGIPAYEILQEKLGLTQKQLQNLGKEGIPASKAINALVDGMNERFGGVVAASSKTLKGIISNIKDNATMLISGAFEPLITYIKSGLNALGEFLFKMREIFELKGLGGVFEAIFPPELHSTIRMFVANLGTLFQAVIRLVGALGGLLRPILEALIRVFNAFAPILTTVLNVLSVMVSWITQNATAMKILTAALAAAAAMWVVFKVKALATAVVASVISLISKALAGLSAMLTFVAAHPFWSLLIALTGLVVGLSGGFGKLSDAISGMFKKVTAINGIDPDKVLLPSQKERANDLNKFNESLDDTKDSMDKLADSTGKATKAAKGLLSFDEVFKLNQPDEGTNNGIDTDTDFDMPDLSGLDASSFIPEVPSFEGFANNFVTDMVNALKEKFIGAGIGAIIGGILGGILGGPLGAKIGAIAGAIAGWFWSDLANALGLTDVRKVALPIATGLGAVIGALIGGPLGAIIGAGIGALVGWFWGDLANALGLTDVGKLAIPLATVLGGALGYVVGHPLIGAGIGLLIGWLIDSITNGIQNGDWSNVAMPVGIGLGAAIGALVGHPLIGAAIGALVGWVGNKLIEGFQTGNFNWPAIATPIGGGIGAAIGMIAGGPVGALIGAAIGTLVGWIAGKFLEADWSKVREAFMKPFKTFGESVGELWSSIWEPIKEAFDSGDWASLGLNVILGIIVGILAGVATIIGAVVTFFQAVWNAFCEIFGIHSPAKAMVPIGLNIILGVLEGFKEAFVQLLEWIATAGLELITAIGTWFINIKDNIAAWCSDTFTTIGAWVESAGSTIAGWASSAGSAIAGWASSAGSAIAGWVSSTSSRIISWVSSTTSKFTGWVTSTANSIANWAVRVGNSFATWSTNSLSKITNFVTNALAKFTSFVSTGIAKFRQFVSNTVSNIGNWASNMSSRASSAMSTFVMQVGNGFSNAMSRVQNFVSQSLSAIGSWASSFGSKVSSVISSASSAISSFTSSVGSRVSSIVSPARSRLSSTLPGHATGGVFNREHIARFAEGNKAEAVIPLENAGAMQPFVDAVANGITASLMPIVANISGNQGQLQPLYVGTLIADERSLKELNRKMQVIQLQENNRRGR